jgi:ABC-type uncharacterized transport system permease subunit
VAAIRARAVGVERVLSGALGPLLRGLLALLVAIALLVALVAALGASPAAAVNGMISATFGNSIGLNITLVIVATLTFTGLAAAIPFSAGVFNLGADGQFTAGAIAATATVFVMPFVTPVLLIALAIVAGALGGALWGLVPGLLKARLGASEVITTLMLNYVAGFIVDIIIRGPWADQTTPQTKPLPDAVSLPSIGPGHIVPAMLLIAIGVAILLAFVMRSTVFGYAVRVTGMSQLAATRAGFLPRRVTWQVMMLGGAVAGLGGGLQIVAVQHALVPGVSATFGLVGVAVALVAGLRPIYCLLSAAFFAVVTVGGNSLPASTGLTTDAALVLEGVIVICLLAMHTLGSRWASKS